jgi:hypothetical protein
VMVKVRLIASLIRSTGRALGIVSAYSLRLFRLRMVRFTLGLWPLFLQIDLRDGSHLKPRILVHRRRRALLLNL